MSFPMPASGDRSPSGHSYAAVLLPRSDGSTATEPVLAALRDIRFSGWVTGPHDGWLVVVSRYPGTVAAGRRGVLGVGEALVSAVGGSALAFLIRQDRQLLLVGWHDGAEVGRYLSDPSLDFGKNSDVLSDPIGEEHAEAFAELAGRPEAAEELGELLAEELDTEETIESERLTGIARVLGLPTWLASLSTLPRELPIGPARSEFRRLGGGRTGILAGPLGSVLDLTRSRRPPAAAITDPPRGAGPGEYEAWMF